MIKLQVFLKQAHLKKLFMGEIRNQEDQKHKILEMVLFWNTKEKLKTEKLEMLRHFLKQKEKKKKEKKYIAKDY